MDAILCPLRQHGVHYVSAGKAPVHGYCVQNVHRVPRAKTAQLDVLIVHLLSSPYAFGQISFQGARGGDLIGDLLICRDARDVLPAVHRLARHANCAASLGLALFEIIHQVLVGHGRIVNDYLRKRQ